jgi:hypothetical protein
VSLLLLQAPLSCHYVTDALARIASSFLATHEHQDVGRTWNLEFAAGQQCLSTACSCRHSSSGCWQRGIRAHMASQDHTGERPGHTTVSGPAPLCRCLPQLLHVHADVSVPPYAVFRVLLESAASVLMQNRRWLFTSCLPTAWRACTRSLFLIHVPPSHAPITWCATRTWYAAARSSTDRSVISVLLLQLGAGAASHGGYVWRHRRGGTDMRYVPTGNN